MAVPPMAEVDLGQVFRALADPLRRAVIAELAAGPADSERACSSFGMPVTKSTKTHHWRALREAGLILQRDAGNGTFVRLRRAEFESVMAALSDPIRVGLVRVLSDDREHAAPGTTSGHDSPACWTWC